MNDLPIETHGAETLGMFFKRDIPHQRDTLPDGREAIVFGDPEGCKEFNHKQGDNDLGYRGTCGLVSCEDILNQFGKNVTENEIVHHARDNDLCTNNRFLEWLAPELCGGTTPENQAHVLKDYGVPARVKDGASIDDLARFVEDGRGVIIEINAETVWEVNEQDDDSDGRANHAVVVTGLARDPVSGKVQGFYINDSGSGKSGQFVNVKTMQQAWSQATGPYGGGCCVVTNSARPATKFNV